MRITITAIAAALILAGCCQSPEVSYTAQIPTANELAALNDIQTQINEVFINYTDTLQVAAIRINQERKNNLSNNNTVKMLQEGLPHVKLASTLDLQGVRMVSFPENYLLDAKVDTAIKDAGLIMDKVKLGMPIIGGMQRNAIGCNIIEYVMPVMENDSIVTGAVSIQFAVTEMLERIVAKEIAGLTVNVWIIQTDGLILYDTNSSEIGLNVLRDDPFIQFPSLTQCARRIISNETGTGSYVYKTKAMKEARRKSTQWDSINVGGRQWRIILNLEDRNFLRGQ